MSKRKNGRDYIELTEVVASVQENLSVRISDVGSSIVLTASDWQALKEFVEAKLKEKNT